MEEMTVRLEKLKPMRAAHVHVLSETPEEDANRKLMGWAERNGAVRKEARLFGRNTYPTDNPEPHGYEFFLTITQNVKLEGDVDLKEVAGGSYAVLRVTGLEKIGEAWRKLWKWFEENKREHAGFRKEEHGWVDGYEEHVNWQENKPPSEWVFDLWVKLKE